MNLFLINSLTLLLSCIGSSAFNIFSQLPVGPYRIVFKQISKCDSSDNYKIRHHFYLSNNYKTNVTYLRGYINSSTSFDDTLSLEINVSKKDADGNWKNNTYFHKTPKACTSFKYLMGTQWTAIMDGLGIKNATCPIPPGVYMASGMDTSLLMNSNLPKTFIYGLYKIRFFYTFKKEVYGCNYFIIEIKPI